MYFIYDCNDNIVGNPKGYRTFRGADQQANMHKSKAFKTIWENFNQKCTEMDAQGVPAGGRLIYSIRKDDEYSIK